MKRFPCLLVILSTFAVAAHADDGATGLYLSTAAGKSVVEDYSSTAIRYDLMLGWQPFRYLAVEAGYINLGRHDNPGSPDPVLRIDGFGGALVGLLPVSDRTTLLGRLGLHKLDIEEGFEAYEVKLARIVGVGAEWSATGPLAFRLELQGIYGIHDRHASGTYQAASLTVGALYRF